ncbi:hypothetical protein L596_021734 [Steinernema carpocapsae]|uniref:AMP-dependent synthetase/ligase domain-containing protein n=1 Tax=Steinernema carpocapsae TaxID=34508 RepID=A0A4U5MJN5_STECR|nr:hypothetical protein L596_021734 [Steinernema carpocapsae]
MIHKSLFGKPLPIKGSFPAIVLDALKKNGDKTALIHAETKQKVSFAKLHQQAHSVASYLEKIGFKKGHVACSAIPNCLEFPALVLGVTMQGGVFSGTNFAFTEYELESIFGICNPKLVLCHSSNLDRVLKIKSKLPSIQHIILVPEKNESAKPYPEGVVPLAEVLETPVNPHYKLTEVDVIKDPMIMPHSSGTTGPPKAVMLSSTNLASVCTVFNDHVEKQIMQKIDPSYKLTETFDLIIQPVSFVYGFRVLFSNLIYGQTSVLMPRFDLELYCKNVEEYKVRFLKMTPPLFVLLCKSPVVDNYDMSSVQAIMTCSAPLGQGLSDLAMKRFENLKVVGQAFAQSETNFITTMTHEPKLGASGKLLPHLEMKVMDVETKESLEYNKPGEICVRGSAVMIGYSNRPEATAEAIDSEGWLHTGDVGYVDEDGFLFVVDRLKEMIKVEGYQVAPAEIEDILLKHPNVQDSAVVGKPDDFAGEVPVAFVVLSNTETSKEEVMSFVNDQLVRYKHLKDVFFIEKVPKSITGKISRRLLREQFKK